MHDATPLTFTRRRSLHDSLGIFVGFASFFIMEKTLRVLGGEDEGESGHSHTITAPEVTNARGCNRSDQSPRLAANLLRFSCNLLRCVRMRSVYTSVKES